MGRRKRPGLDGRHSVALGFLPDPILECLCDLHDAIEEKGEWGAVEPEGFRPPKPGGGQTDPMQRRPMWLFLIVYR
eukprot:11174516-Lingulodinium_polyedra.AAC.1